MGLDDIFSRKDAILTEKTSGECWQGHKGALGVRFYESGSG